MLPGKNSTLGKLTFANSAFLVDGNGEGRGGQITQTESKNKNTYKNSKRHSKDIVNHTIRILQSTTTAKLDGGQWEFTIH